MPSKMVAARKFLHSLGTGIGIFCVALGSQSLALGQEIYRMSNEETRWFSPENPTGAKASGGKTNKGAKGNAFLVVPPGATVDLAKIKGAGVIRRMWMSGTIPRSPEQRRAVKIQMFWDGASKPAVDCPIGDFFGVGLGMSAKFENALFSNPEGRSFNFTIPMPYRKSAHVKLVNESSSVALVWYDLNLTVVKEHPKDVLYFHASWRRDSATKLGVDFEVLPKVVGKGRFLGSNIGVIGNPGYQGTWFGEGEVKIFLDGDRSLPSLIGTGTEDYIGTGWGQGVYAGREAGSLVSDEAQDLYSFYRFHLSDPVFFQKDCRVTLQQMGNGSPEQVKAMLAKGVPVKPVLVMDFHGEDIFNLKRSPTIHRLLDAKGLPPFTDAKHPQGGTNFFRSDDLSATAYFYLDRPSNSLKEASLEERMHDLAKRVWPFQR